MFIVLSLGDSTIASPPKNITSFNHGVSLRSQCLKGAWHRPSVTPSRLGFPDPSPLERAASPVRCRDVEMSALRNFQNKIRETQLLKISEKSFFFQKTDPRYAMPPRLCPRCRGAGKRQGPPSSSKTRLGEAEKKTENTTLCLFLIFRNKNHYLRGVFLTKK